MENYEQKYKEALGRANAKIETYNHLGNVSAVKSICEIFPELKESEDEKIRKRIIEFLSTPFVKKGMSEGALSTWIAWLEKQDKERVVTDVLIKAGLKAYKDGNKWCILVGDNIQDGICGFGDTVDEALFEFLKELVEKQGEKVDVIENFDTEFEKQVSHLIASAINKEHEYNEGFVKWTSNALLNYAKHELEKKDGLSYPYQPGWRKNYSGNKPKVKHSVLMLTTHGIAEGEWLGEEWCQYRWSCKVKDTEVLYWMHLSDLENLEKENEKRVEQKPTWSEEEKARIDKIIDVLDWAEEKGHIRYSDWEDYVCYVKSLKPQNTWKPSDEQIEVLYKYAEQNNHDGSVLTSLYRDLKKLK